jgi:hypothetical protein
MVPLLDLADRSPHTSSELSLARLLPTLPTSQRPSLGQTILAPAILRGKLLSPGRLSAACRIGGGACGSLGRFLLALLFFRVLLQGSSTLLCSLRQRLLATTTIVTKCVRYGSVVISGDLGTSRYGGLVEFAQHL